MHGVLEREREREGEGGREREREGEGERDRERERVVDSNIYLGLNVPTVYLTDRLSSSPQLLMTSVRWWSSQPIPLIFTPVPPSTVTSRHQS